MKLRIIFFTALASIVACSFLYRKGTAVSPDMLKQWIDKGALIVDVRTPEEYAVWHFKASLNIPLADLEDNIGLFGAKEKNIIVYCRKGNRSGDAKSILEKHGYKNVINGGGLEDMQPLE